MKQTGVTSRWLGRRGRWALAAAMCLWQMAASAAPNTTLMLFSGAGIRPATETLIKAFEAANPGVKISATYGGSGHLLGQVGTFKRGDLFMPGEGYYIDQAVSNGLAVAATRRAVGRFEPVLFTAQGNPRKITGVRDLGQPGLRLGIGDPRANAVGILLVKLLETLDAETARAIRANVAFQSATVDELATAVKLGAIDATLLWEVVARQFTATGGGTIVHFAESKDYCATIPIVRLQSSTAPELADAFIAFACGAQGQALLKPIGYALPETNSEKPKKESE